MSLILTVAIQGRAAADVDGSSLLSAFISGEEVSEGPLDPAAYAQTDAPGVGGARLAAVDGSGSPDITFDDPEVTFSATLGGNVAQAPLSPLSSPDPADTHAAAHADSSTKRDTFLYTVQEGDTIAAIAQKYDITPDTILSANGIAGNDVIKVGDHLTILPTSGVVHTVASGDTLLAIAQKYDAKADAIAEYNGLADAGALSIGKKLIIPGGHAAVQHITPPQIVAPHSATLADADDGKPTPEPVKVSGAGMLWPTVTRHLSQYFKGGHTGIDIDNRSLPPIYAALDGTVEFAGWLGGYGNLLIVNHGGGLQTYYAHTSKFYVGKGEKVSKGQAIAKMGSTGHSTGPHLHFEVRRNGRPINPLGMF